ncbi:MAG: permease prefix domain 1-containing protein [Xanthomonadales bacterium]|nr:permease prefix domain 1-containing protein [Xanthomonadales bacterium]
MHTEPSNSVESLEAQIETWRGHLQRGQAIGDADVAELEDHLREQIASLTDSGLAEDEAFLVAVKRVGAVDALTREFARAHSERLWKQLVLSGGDPANPVSGFGSKKMWMALALATAAGAAIKLPAMFGVSLRDPGAFYPLNIAFFTLPFMIAFFAWERPLPASKRLWLALPLVFAALVVNLFPFSAPGSDLPIADTQFLVIIHLPIALWLLVGVAYAGGQWRGSERRMDFIRFTGELFIYYVLIALGGWVLIGLTFVLFGAIGIDMEPVVESWILPCGVAGATVVATWLVEAKQSVIENMAPVLARIFVPLFTLALLAFVATMAATGRGIDVEREILIALDLLLVVVFGLLLYSISSRDPLEPPGPLDWIQLVLVGTALLVDVLALWAIWARIADLGFTPNRTAALGMNLILLVNLAGSALYNLRFLRGNAAITALWNWQMRYLYVLAAWGAVVAFLFPPLFGFR